MTLLGGVLIASVCAFAQVTTSSIRGSVNDKSGAVVGAPVVAVHTPSGSSFYAVTDKNGAYRINGLNPGGPYTVTIEMLGYRKVETNGVYAPLGETITVNATLEEEALNLEAAVFTADATDSGMNISRSGAGTSVSLKTMTALPTVSRTMYDVMKLTPQSSSNSNGTSIGGGTYRSSFVSVDGAAFQNSFGIGSNLPAGGAPISLDALEQLSINLTPFDVRQSGFTGGAINAVTKSGTNDWHASVYNYFTNDQLTGDRIGEQAQLSLSKSLSNTTGVTVGGPIIKNKLFFFINAEYSPETVPSKYVTSEDGVKFGGQTKRPTAAFMDEVTTFLKEKYGYDPGPYQNYSIAAPDWKVMARIDWNINRDHRFNVRFNYTSNNSASEPSSSVSPFGRNDLYNRDNNGRTSDYALFFRNTMYSTEDNFMSLSAELNSRFLEGKVNNLFRVIWSHQDTHRTYEGGIFPTVDILEDNAAGEKTVKTTFGLDPFTLGNLRDVQTVVATDEVSIMKGINNIIAGLQFEWDRTKNGYMQMGSGYYLYNSWDDFKNDVKPAAFAITYPNNDALSQAYPTFDYMQASAYVQDELNISDNFKLTAGLRFELPFYPSLKNNHNKEFSTLAENSQTFKGLNTDDVPKARFTVSPRIGFNWDILKNRNLILRGGTGIYTGRIPFVWIVSAVGNSNCIQAQYFDKTGNTDVKFHKEVSDIVKDLENTDSYKTKDLPAPQNATILDRKLSLPSTWKSSLALEGRIPGGIKATIEGIYSKDLTTVKTTKLGIVEKEGGITLPGEPKARTLWESEGINNSQGKGVTPYYLTNTSKNQNGYYYSITAQLQKDFNFGLSLMAAYTFSDSQSINEGYGDQVSSMFGANSYSVNGSNVPELGRSGYVAPHRAIANISYTINEGKRGKTTFGLFYEGMNHCYVGNYSYNRYSYVMNSVTGDGGSANLIYIPTAEELKGMPFTSDQNRDEYEDFISADKYLSKHRGEYSKRGIINAPWQNRFNFKFVQDINFNTNHAKIHTIQIGLDINNIGNLLNSKWGLTDRISSEQILKYSDSEGKYTFTAPTWTKWEGTYSTWSMLVSLRYFF